MFTINPGNKYDSGGDSDYIFYMYGYLELYTQPDLVAKYLACLTTKPEHMGRFPVAHIFSVCFSLLHF